MKDAVLTETNLFQEEETKTHIYTSIFTYDISFAFTSTYILRIYLYKPGKCISHPREALRLEGGLLPYVASRRKEGGAGGGVGVAPFFSF